MEEKHNPAESAPVESTSNGLDHAVDAEGDIPDFLLVKNRKPLTKKQKACVDVLFKNAHQDVERVDWRKPRSISWEEWDAHLAREETPKREKSLGPDRRAQGKVWGSGQVHQAEEARGRAERFAPDSIISVLVSECPYRPGSAGAAVFGKYRDGMTVREFEADAAGLTGKRRPVDMLTYDVGKGRVKVGPASISTLAPKPKKGKKL